ncbi:hypothetical protein DFS34DRAFT_78790 [Phlyctochytrium arcticum]|nr:hypothetical protein DFS34DRAFT_78790 [Phlyctochytrium arcticum]
MSVSSGSQVLPFRPFLNFMTTNIDSLPLNRRQSTICEDGTLLAQTGLSTCSAKFDREHLPKSDQDLFTPEFTQCACPSLVQVLDLYQSPECREVIKEATEEETELMIKGLQNIKPLCTEGNYDQASRVFLYEIIYLGRMGPAPTTSSKPGTLPTAPTSTGIPEAEIIAEGQESTEAVPANAASSAGVASGLTAASAALAFFLV